MPDVEMAERVRELREAAGLSQRKLAPICGVERTTIQKLEAGKLIPSVALVEQLGSVLGVPSAAIGSPHACGCGCEGLTFAEYLPGHAPNPNAGQPCVHESHREGPRPLRDTRLEKGLTLQELAVRVGASPQHLSQIENGEDEPSERLALAMEAALGREFFKLQACPCGCERRTVGGRYAKGHYSRSSDWKVTVAPKSRARKRAWWASPASDAWRAELPGRMIAWWATPDGEVLRRRLRASWVKHWRTGGKPVRQLFEAAKAGLTPVPIPAATRQAYGRRWGGNTPPKPGARPRGNQPIDQSKADAIISRWMQNRRLSVRAIARLEHVSKTTAAEVLAPLRAEKVSAKSSG